MFAEGDLGRSTRIRGAFELVTLTLPPRDGACKSGGGRIRAAADLSLPWQRNSAATNLEESNFQLIRTPRLRASSTTTSRGQPKKVPQSTPPKIWFLAINLQHSHPMAKSCFSSTTASHPPCLTRPKSGRLTPKWSPGGPVHIKSPSPRPPQPPPSPDRSPCRSPSCTFSLGVVRRVISTAWKRSSSTSDRSARESQLTSPPVRASRKSPV